MAKKPLPDCNDSRPCFAKDEKGKCTILEFGKESVKTERDMVYTAEILNMAPGTTKTIIRQAYKNGECPFCKECYKDVVIDKQVKRKHTGDCTGCPAIYCKRRITSWI